MENHAQGRVTPTGLEREARDEGAVLRAYLESNADLIDSPKTLLIIRNAVSAFLEVGAGPSQDKIYALLTDASYRSRLIEELRRKTPEPWSEGWNAAWRKDVDPLLSKSHEEMARRNGLVNFWMREWMTMPDEIRAHAICVVRSST